MKYSALSFAVLTAFTFASCKKTLDKSPGNISNTNPLQLISQLAEREESDFSIKISTSFGHSLFTANSTSNASVLIEAASIGEMNVGELDVNGTHIPFKDKSYFYQLEAGESPQSYTGQNNTYNFNGSTFPTFNVNEYSSAITDVSVEGVADDNKKLPRGQDLTINWTPDGELPGSAQCGVYVSGETVDGTIVTLTKMVNDSDGSASISSAELNNFADMNRIKVYYARGFGNVHTINGKTVEIGSIGFTYVTIFFN